MLIAEEEGRRGVRGSFWKPKPSENQVKRAPANFLVRFLKAAFERIRASSSKFKQIEPDIGRNFMFPIFSGAFLGGIYMYTLR